MKQKPTKAQSEYYEKLKDPRWQKKRLLILERDQWKCRSCNCDFETLVVHHIRYLKNAEPWDYPDGLLITLCDYCHEKETMERREIEAELLEVIRDRGIMVRQIEELLGMIEDEQIPFSRGFIQVKCPTLLEKQSEDSK